MAMETEFGGRIGTDWRDSEPWWPPEPARPTARRTWCSSSSTTSGFAQLGCYGSDIDTPVIDGLAAGGRAPGQLPHHGAVLAHPGLPADRPQPPPQRDGPGGRPGHRASPATGGSRRGRTATCPRSCAAAGYATYAVGKWHLTPEDETNMAASRAHLAARPRLRPLVRLPRRRDPPVRPGPLPRQPLRPAARGRSRTATT